MICDDPRFILIDISDTFWLYFIRGTFICDREIIVAIHYHLSKVNFLHTGKHT